MEKNKVKKTISIVLIVAVVIFGLWIVIIYPLIRFNANENTVLEATKRYFQINSSRLPSEGEITTVEVTTLLDQKYITDLRTAYNHDTCSARNSWVKVKKVSGEYKYYVYLECGAFSSAVDHKGPEITLNGDLTINVEKDSKFTDPGIKSVKDNTDGIIENKEVVVKSNVDTTKIGSYDITYTAVDSFLNKTEVTRKVVVSQNLSTTVKNATDKDNVYKGVGVNNYIKFSGQLFRIVGVNEDNTVKIVSEENISQVDYKSLNKWLNDYYYKYIAENSKKYLVTNYNWCNDSVNSSDVDKKSDCSSKKTRQTIGILAINDYNRSLKEGDSYLYTNTINWTSSNVDSKKAWTTKDAFIGETSKYMSFSESYNFNIRPAMVLKNNIKITSGSGTITDPYEIGDFKKASGGTKVNERYSGEYIDYKGITYRIIDPNVDGYSKVISINNVYQGTVTHGEGSLYNPNKSDNVGYFIENELSKYIKVGVFTKHQVTVPIYKTTATYTGTKTDKKYNVKFAAPSMYEMYSAYYDSFWYIESSKESNVRYLSSYNGTVYYEMLGLENFDSKVKFTGYLKKSAVIISGDGTENKPYKIEY